jgi:hypothetical protein
MVVNFIITENWGWQSLHEMTQIPIYGSCVPLVSQVIVATLHIQSGDFKKPLGAFGSVASLLAATLY